MTWLAGATPFSTGSDGQSVTIKLSSDSKVKTFVDFWQKMINEDLIDTKTVGWSDDWNKGLNDGSIASLLTGAGCLTTYFPELPTVKESGASPKCRLRMVPKPMQKTVALRLL